jgi:hypothetical protein
MVERFYRQLKDALRAGLQGQDWVCQLPWVLLGLRSAPKEKANISSTERHGPHPPWGVSEYSRGRGGEVGGEIEVRCSLFLPSSSAGPAMKAAEAPAQLLSCKYVYVRGEGARPLLVAKYDGPFLVVAKAAKYFKIQRGTRVERVTVDRLETHLGSGPVAPASPPARSWPRKAAQNEEDILQE